VRANLLRAVLLAVLGLTTISDCAAFDAASSGEAASAPLAAAVIRSAGRRVLPRLSDDQKYAPCARADTTALVCAVPGAALAGATAAASRASTVLRDHVDQDAVRATALVDLLWSDSSGIAMSRAISSLEMAVRLDTTSAASLADLSGAYLLNAEQHARPEELLYAVDAAQRAVVADPEDMAARFNVALALEYAVLDSQAVLAWNAYLQRDSRSGWADEARARRKRLLAARAARKWSSLAALARGAPEHARAFAMDTVLGDWGEAVLAGDSARARADLQSAATLGDAMARARRDSSVRALVRAITRSGPEGVKRLASAHAVFAKARRAYTAAEYAAADSGFARVLALRPAPPLEQWAELGKGLTLGYARKFDRAIVMLRDVVAAEDSQSNALTARAEWGIGNMLLRRGEIKSGLGSIHAAQHTFAQLAERQNLGATQELEAEAFFAIGDAFNGFMRNHSSLVLLAGEGPSVWRHNSLKGLARQSANASLAYATLAAAAEDRVVVEALGNPLWLVEGRLAYADALARANQRAAARTEVETAAVPLPRIRDPLARTQLASELDAVRAPLLADPRRTRAALDAAIAELEKTRNPTLLLPVLLARARTSLVLDEAEAAERDLKEISGLYSALHRSVASAPERAGVLREARAVTEQLVRMRLRSGDTAAALVALERGRTLDPETEVVKRVRSAVAANATTLDMAILGDTVATWLLGHGALRVVRRRVPRSRLVELLSRMRSGLEFGNNEADARATLGQVYDTLIRPIERLLPVPGSRLRLVADEELSGVPFAGLYDAHDRKYLVQRYVIEVDASLRRESAGNASSGGAVAARALFISAPSLEGTPFTGLPELPGAVTEVRAASAAYRDRRVMSAMSVDSASVAMAMSWGEVIHFAGHAVFDSRRPERSLLALAPRGLTAAAISTLDLHRVRLVVLSACETARGGDHDGGAFGGLEEAFLDAGAGGVVSSLWRVDDETTAPLMTALHAEYARSGDAADALRRAQLKLLQSHDASQRAPVAWAAFRYAGR
jgi:CHAT domain-containing protein